MKKNSIQLIKDAAYGNNGVFGGSKNSTILTTNLRLVKILITPELAKDLLELNFSNRSVKTNNLKKIKRAIINGEWDSDNGEVLTINVNGDLTNGQHRLIAIIETGVSVPLHFILNVSEESIITMDSGSPRSASDLLKIKNFKNVSTLSAIISLQFGFSRGNNRLHANDSLSNSKILSIAMENREHLEEMASFGVKFYKETPLITTSEYGTFYGLFTQANQEAADEFFQYLVYQPLLLKNDHPVKKLYDILSRDKKNINGRKLGKATKKALVIRAWNSFYNGKEKIGTLRWRSTEAFPEIAGLDYEVFSKNPFSTKMALEEVS